MMTLDFGRWVDFGRGGGRPFRAAAECAAGAAGEEQSETTRPYQAAATWTKPMIDIRKLKELVRLMVDNDLSELDLKDQQETVTIKRGGTPVPVMAVHPPAAAAVGAAPAAPEADESGPAGSAAAGAGAEDAGLVPIVSPMVGTFYTSPNPDSPSFVAVGAGIGPETTVCLIEAMKVFNEIKAEVSGTIERVLVESGKPVEYGQKLFLVRPN